MGLSLLSFVALAGYTVALPGHINDRLAEAEVITSTITNYAHPLSLSALETLDATATPLSYASSPTPISVPTAGATAAEFVAPAEFMVEEASCTSSTGTEAAPKSTSTSASVSVCISIGGDYPTTTVPAYCNPSHFSNAPALMTPTGTDDASIPTATANLTISNVHDKMECCAQCTRIFNCFAWHFVPVYTQASTDKLPGGFDPWGYGNCELKYHTGGVDDASGKVCTDGAASYCPNGRLEGMLNGTSNVAGPDGETERWSNLYYNGWNDGACSAAKDIFVDATDPGIGDEDSLCDGTS
ncbi:Uu.00g025960.m01.CDS01 [Anthostomella pinea]|uniref:Uu.00g025960.m01.CDS01 n=1 Tax=Anthostomella pinea TaxID=933095 RepID=A0AAI8YCP2_9PEZI|nr:Uu.00g025960.m01.CDS01 [Anthostomella pinea]